MAAALGIALAGPRRYSGIVVDSPFLNASGHRDAKAADISRALRVYVGAWAMLLLAASLVAYLLW
jgi:adenosylcobinamide-phosphate synthase